MARVLPAITTFNAGEWSELMYGRVDIAKYPNACREMLNFVPLPQGPAHRRPGTIFVVETKSSGVARILGFVPRDTPESPARYMLEFGDQYMRVIKDFAQVGVTGQAPSVTNGTFATNVTGWTDGSSGGAAAIAWNAANAALELQSDTGTARAQQTISRTTAVNNVLKFQVKKVWQRTNGTSRVVVTDTGATTFQFLAYEEGWYAIAYTPGGASGTLEFACGGGAGSNPLVDNISYHAVSGAAFDIQTPWALADIDKIVFVASNDVLYAFHPSYPPYKISHYAENSWSVTRFNYRDGPYLAENITATTITPSAVSGNAITLTASNVLGINGGQGFLTTDVGRLVRIKYSADWGYARITAHTSTTVVTAEVIKDFGATTAATVWRLGAWSDTTGWPRAATFHQGRLWVGGTTTQPQTVWATRSNDFETFSPTELTGGTVNDDSGLEFTIADDRVNAILWMKSATKSLIVGTAGGLFGFSASTQGEVMTPDNVRADRLTAKGASALPPIRVDQAILFASKSGRALNELTYSFERDAQVANDMNLLASHMLEDGIKEAYWQAEPWGVIWACTEEGDFRGLTYLREQDVVGWHRHELGGSTSVIDNPLQYVRSSKVISVSGKPGTTQDEVWVVVEREFKPLLGAGVTKRYIEYMSYVKDPFTGTGADEGQAEEEKSLLVYVDSAIVYDGAATSSIAIAHLTSSLGASVAATAIGDGAYYRVSPTFTGNFVFARDVTKAVVGLPYESVLETMDLEAGGPAGTAQGGKKRFDSVLVRFKKTLGAKVGAHGGDMQEIAWRLPGNKMDQSPPLFSGFKIVTPPKGWDKESRVRVTQSLPFPCIVSFLSPRVSTNDRTGG